MSQDTIDTDVWSAVVALLRLKPPLSLIPVRCSLLGRNTLVFRAPVVIKCCQIYVTYIHPHRQVFSNLRTSIPPTCKKKRNRKNAISYTV